MNYFADDLLLNEAYYGKNPLLEDCDRHFDNLIKIINSQKPGIYLKKNEDILKEVEAIEKNIKELFNCKKFILEISGLGFVNAFTISPLINPQSIFSDLVGKNKKELSKYGFKLKPGNNTYIYSVINYEMFNVQGMTGPILTGILLHEIGHNFFGGVGIGLGYRIYMAYETAMSVVEEAVINPIPLFTMSLNQITSISTDIIRKNDKLRKLYSQLNTLTSCILNPILIISGIIGKYKGLYNLITKPIKYFEEAFKNIKNALTPSLIFNYRNEKFADNFASMYGYSKEVIQAEEIFELAPLDTSQRIASSKLQNLINDIDRSAVIISSLFADPHPESITRVKDQLKFLKSQINIVQDKELKKLLLKDISECEKMVGEYDKKIKQAKIQNGKVFTAIYFDLILKMGGDPKEKLSFFKTNNYNYREFKDVVK